MNEELLAAGALLLVQSGALLSFGLRLISWEGYTVRKSTRVPRNLRVFSLENPGVWAW
jgi:hypothetical protein